MFNSSTNSSRIRSKSSSNTRCQASALALNRVCFQKTVSRRGRPAQRLDAACPPLVAGLLSRRPRAVDVLASQPRLEATPAPAHRVAASFAFPPRAASSPQPSAIASRTSAFAPLARHHESALPSSPRAVPWSSLPSPPHRRVNRASVRAFSPFSPSPPSRDLAGAGVPCGQLPLWSFLIFLPLALASVCDAEARRAGH